MIFSKLFKKKEKQAEPVVDIIEPKRDFSNMWQTHMDDEDQAKKFVKATMDGIIKSHPHSENLFGKVAKDSINSGGSTGYINDSVMAYFAGKGFIGWQACAVLSQHWLIYKACWLPASDAFRNGYEVAVNSGQKITPEIDAYIRSTDSKYNITQKSIDFLTKARIFGIRIAMFNIESDDPLFYEKPFNIDGVKPGSYKGISQIDPYYVVPQFTGDALSNPSSMNYFTPTYWQVHGKKIHKSHLCIYIPFPVPDIIKPQYVYGGIPLTQKLYERVFSAERVANEIPQLALTKRTNILSTNLQEVATNPDKFSSRIKKWVYLWNNYGIKVIDKEDEAVTQTDTNIYGVPEAMNTQYQLVAAIADIPATRLLGSSPEGFIAGGEYESSTYGESIKVIQTIGAEPLLRRHYDLVIKSEVAEKFGVSEIKYDIVFASLYQMSDKEKAELNKAKADAGAQLIASGAIDPVEERERVVNDPDSGYSGLSLEEDDYEEDF